jgi:hypothetical protein
MASANEHGTALLDDLRRLIADEGFTIAIFAAAATAAILAFGFGATSDIVAAMLIVGVATAFVESRLLRTGKKS